MHNYSEKESPVIRNVFSGQVVSETAKVSAEIKASQPISVLADFCDISDNSMIKAPIDTNYLQI